MDFTQNTFNKEEKKDENDNGEVNCEVNANSNSDFELLNAENYDTAYVLSNNLHDSVATSYLNMFDSLTDDQIDTQLNVDNYRNAGNMLDQLDDDINRDVYRSVAGVEFNSQYHMAIGGETNIDTPFELLRKDDHLKSTKIPLQPSARLFTTSKSSLSSLYIACPLNELVEKIDGHLKLSQVDFVFDSSECVWRGMIYPKEPVTAVDFRIYLNTTPHLEGANRFVIEFIRREGCANAFFSLFAEIRDLFLRCGIITDDKGEFINCLDDFPKPFANVKWGSSQNCNNDNNAPIGLARSLSNTSTTQSSYLSFDDDYDDEDDSFLNDLNCSDEELYKPLYNMSMSNFEDVHVQGLALISHECRRNSKICKALVLACPGIIDLLKKRLVETENQEVKRHCLTSFANIAKCEEFHKMIDEANVCSLFADIAASTYSPFNGEIQRQAATTLENLCAVPHTRSTVLKAVQAKFEKFSDIAQNCGDKSLTKIIMNVHFLLQELV